MKIHAAIARSANDDFSIEEVDLNDPLDGQVRVKISACGICRSDLSALEGKETIQYPVVLGHEAAGMIAAVGKGVKQLKEGDSVVLSWTSSCGACPSCVRGKVHLCSGISMTTEGKGPLSQGGEGLDRFMGLGAFAEYVVVPEAMAIPIKTKLHAHHACLIGCGVTTGFGAAVNTAAIRWGETVAVLGCGGVGLATDALAPDDITQKIVAATNGGVDCAIECVGNTATMADCFSMIRQGGRAVAVGLPAYTDLLSIPAIMLLAEGSL